MNLLPFAAIAVALGVASCNTRNALPPGPAPEYEPARVIPWDAGAGAEGDPFDEAAEGDWIDDDADRSPDAGAVVGKDAMAGSEIGDGAVKQPAPPDAGR